MTEPAEDTVEITLPFSASLVARIDALAAATGRSRASVISDAVVLMVAEHEERATGEASSDEAAASDAGGEPPGPTYFSGG